MGWEDGGENDPSKRAGLGDGEVDGFRTEARQREAAQWSGENQS